MSLVKNQEIDLTIESFGNSGEGVAHVDGYALFVSGALPGERVHVVVTKVKKNYGYARLLSVLDASPDRVEPLCPVYKRCGGCELQHMSYEAQLRFKTERVYDCLTRIGRLSGNSLPGEIPGESTVRLEVIGCEGEPWRYRNKAQFPVGYDKNGNIVTGFYVARSHEIIPCDECYIQDKKISGVVTEIISILNKYNNGALVYDETEHSGLIRHIYIRHGQQTDRLVVCLVLNVDEAISDGIKMMCRECGAHQTGRCENGALGDDIKMIGSEGSSTRTGRSENRSSGEEIRLIYNCLSDIFSITDVSGVCININNKRTNVITGDKYISVFGDIFIEDKIGDITFRIAPESFYQVNPNMTDKLYGKALEYASLTGDEVVWDLYCGIGTISLFLAKKAKKVVGVEIVDQAIKNAKENAKINSINNAEFICGAAEEIIDSLVNDGLQSSIAGVTASTLLVDEDQHGIGRSNSERELPDVVVVDPPRKGCDEKLISAIGKASPARIVYVSCDPATLARDIARLREYGYELKKACVVDQFWQTKHVETCALLTKSSASAD